MRSTIALLALSLLASCGDLEPDCSLELRYSVQVFTGDDVAESVTYSVDGSSPSPCEATDGYWVCGAEEAGAFVIEATFPTGTATSTVTVQSGECHVRTENVTLAAP